MQELLTKSFFLNLCSSKTLFRETHYHLLFYSRCDVAVRLYKFYFSATIQNKRIIIKKCNLRVVSVSSGVRVA